MFPKFKLIADEETPFGRFINAVVYSFLFAAFFSISAVLAIDVETGLGLGFFVWFFSFVLLLFKWNPRYTRGFITTWADRQMRDVPITQRDKVIVCALLLAVSIPFLIGLGYMDRVLRPSKKEHRAHVDALLERSAQSESQREQKTSTFIPLPESPLVHFRHERSRVRILDEISEGTFDINGTYPVYERQDEEVVVSSEMTLLMSACRDQDPSRVKLLLEAGARMDVADSYGKPGDYLWERFWDEFRKQGRTTSGLGRCLVLFLQHGYTREPELYEEGENVLHLIAAKARDSGGQDISELLLKDPNWKVNAPDKYGWTPLFYAALKQNYYDRKRGPSEESVAMTKFLLEHGADPHLRSTQEVKLPSALLRKDQPQSYPAGSTVLDCLELDGRGSWETAEMIRAK